MQNTRKKLMDRSIVSELHLKLHQQFRNKMANRFSEKLRGLVVRNDSPILLVWDWLENEKA